MYFNLNEMKNVPWVSNASVTIIEYSDKKWNCIKVSEDKHLSKLKTVFPSNV